MPADETPMAVEEAGRDVPSLDGCRAKTERAHEHVLQINREILAGRIDVPSDAIRAQYKVQIPHAGHPGTHEIVFTLRGDPPPIPVIFSLLAGEAVHQLRSTLDHLVYQLVIAHTQQPPARRTQFPIVGRGHGSRTAAEEYEAVKRRMIQGVSLAAEARLDELQPFHRGADFNEDPLWILAELNNTDKHRLLVLTVHRVSAYLVTVTNRGTPTTASFAPNLRFEHGAEIGRMPVADPPLDDAHVSVDGDLVVQPAFSEVGGREHVPVIPCLTELCDYVGGIVEAFRGECEIDHG